MITIILYLIIFLAGASMGMITFALLTAGSRADEQFYELAYRDERERADNLEIANLQLQDDIDRLEKYY